MQRSRLAHAVTPLSSQICAGHLLVGREDRTDRPAGTPDWILVLTLRGLGRSIHHDQPHLFLDNRPAMISLTPPHTPLITVGHPGWEHLWCHFLPRPHWVEWMDWPATPCGVRRLHMAAVPARRSVLAAFRRVVRLTTTAAGEDREMFAMNCLEELLLWCNRLKPQEASTSVDPRIDVCLQHITSHYAQPIALGDLARISRQSISRISHLFRQFTGMSPMQFLEEHRMERAMRLLTHGAMRIREVAAEVGFRDPFYFTNRFHRHTGYSPRAFRVRSRQPAPILRRPGLRLNPEDRQLRDKNWEP